MIFRKSLYSLVWISISYFQVVSQDRLLTEIRDDDTVMLEKISLLENHLRRTKREIATQTDFESNQLNQSKHASILDREHLRYVYSLDLITLKIASS